MSLKILIVDDTAIYRKILQNVVADIDGAEVLATAPNGELALKRVEAKRPDLILLDVEMPGISGLDTLKQIKEIDSSIGVIMVSGISEKQAEVTLQCLNAGAMDFIAKPTGRNFSENTEYLKRTLIPIVSIFKTKKALASVGAKKTVVAKPKVTPKSVFPVKTKQVKPVAKLTTAPNPKRFDVIVIGVSTGGPNALHQVIPKLPKNLGVPILLVQHMPPMFTKSLASHLNEKSELEVMEAEDGQIVTANQVVIAQGGKHMVVKSLNAKLEPVIAINEDEPVNSCRPSVDVLFESVANKYRGNILSLIMTGMGADGLNGVRMLKKIGCLSLTQTQETCTVWGMPRAVFEAGLSDKDIPLDKLAQKLTDLVKNGH